MPALGLYARCLAGSNTAIHMLWIWQDLRLRTFYGGVFQGSVIGPLLFVLYINNILDLFDGDEVSKLYADDMKLYYTIDSDADRSRLQSRLNSHSE